MALLDFGRLMRAAGQTIQGLPENAGVMGGLSLLSANQPGQRNPVDQPGSFLKGMLQANSLKQNRLALEEAAKEKARQEAMRIQREQARAALMPTLTPQNQMMFNAFPNNPDVIKSMIASQNPKPAEYTDIQYEPTTGRPFGYNKSTGVVEYIPMNTLRAQNLQPSNGVPAVSAVDNNGVAASAASDPNIGFELEKPKTALELKKEELEVNKLESEQLARANVVKEKQQQVNLAKQNATAAADRSLDAIKVIDAVLKENPEGGIDFAGPTGKSGQFTQLVAGTPRYEIDAQLKTIYAAFGFGTLAEMREASKTGGALGAINESEMALLIASVISLDPNTRRSTFDSQLKKVQKYFNDIKDKSKINDSYSDYSASLNNTSNTNNTNENEILDLTKD